VSLIRNTAWYFIGNASSSSAQLLIVLLVARFGDAHILGKYSLALAICSPAFLFSECKLREVIASDVFSRFSDQEYFALRLITATTIAGCLFLGSILLTDMDGLGKTIVAISVWRSFDSIGDIAYGWLQRRKQMRTIGISMSLRSTIIVIALIFGLTILKDLNQGILLAATGSGVILLTYDFGSIRMVMGKKKGACNTPWAKWPGIRRLFALARSVIPLGFVSGLTSLRVAIPRYFITIFLGERLLGYFTAAYALPAAGTVVVNSFGQTLLPHLAETYKQKRINFWRYLTKALVVIAAIATGGLLIAIFMGDELLEMIYGFEYRKVHNELIGLSLAVGLTFGCSIFGISLIAVGSFRSQVPIYVSVVSVVALSCFLLIPVFGLMGAVYGMILSTAVWLILSVVVLKRVYKKQIFESR
jgi:O-antigen/teichoic acid export membrane protein